MTFGHVIRHLTDDLRHDTIDQQITIIRHVVLICKGTPVKINIHSLCLRT